MEQSLHDLQDELGGANPFSERQMREALYETYFDVPDAIAFLVQEREREEALAKKKAGTCAEAGREGRRLGVRGRGRGRGRGGARRGGERTSNGAGAAEGTHGAQEASVPVQEPNGASTTPPTLASAPAPARAPAAPAPAPSAPTPSAPAAASQPKLSKLQQKMQAARLKGKPASKTTGTTAQALGAPAAAAQRTPTPSRPSTPSSPAPAAAAAPPVATVPSGESIARLFPAPAPAHGAPSPFVQLLERPVSKSAHPLPSVSVSEDEMQNLRQVFSTLSPDDIVLQARRGTRLAQ